MWILCTKNLVCSPTFLLGKIWQGTLPKAFEEFISVLGKSYQMKKEPDTLLHPFEQPQLAYE